MSYSTTPSPRIYMECSALIYANANSVKILVHDTNATEISLNYGNVIYIEKGCYLSLRHKEKTSSDVIKVVSLSEEILKKIAKVMGIISPINNEYSNPTHKYFFVNDIPLANYFFSDLTESFSTKEENQVQFASNLMYLLSFFYCQTGFMESIERAITYRLSDKIYKMVSSDIDVKWTLPMCARLLYISPSTLKRKLFQEGETFSGIYQDARMNRSISLLITTSKSIANIASDCGFSSSSSFSTAFKKKYGLSPKQLAKKQNIY